MKKTLFTIAVLMTMAFGANAQSDAFFKWNNADNETYRDIDNGISFALPTAHGYEYDSEAPLGTGLLILTALGAGYAIKRRKE
ncbi:MAG: hypothetical protein IKS65_04740 [Bacteroidales bacterium]|nr:hypothetical protein [Bacteroidales bacterium]